MAKWGIILVLISIIMGAFGAHYFSEILSPERFDSLKTGIQYQMYMGLALIALNSIEEKFNASSFKRATRLILVGTLLFSLSIYGLVYLGHKNVQIGKPILGPITPVGGLFMIIGWFFLLFSFRKE